MLQVETFQRPRPPAYALELDRKEQDPRLTRKHLETHVGERFNVILSTANYEIKEGKIFGEGFPDPFLDVMRRGRDFRRRFGNPVDWEREDAEIMGFEKVQNIMTDENTPLGAIVLSVSRYGREGSTYKHNFYDSWQLKDVSGKRIVEMKRFSSGLDIPDYIRLFAEMGIKIPPNADDVLFLSNPIKIPASRFKTPDDIHKFLHRDHNFLRNEEFRVILEAISPLVTSYINALSRGDKWMQALSYNAILNRADQVYDEMREGLEIIKPITTQEYIYMLGSLPVKEREIPCGVSGGFSVLDGKSTSPFSVSEYGILGDKTTLCCTCPFCKKEVEAVIAKGKITCPECKASSAWSKAGLN